MIKKNKVITIETIGYAVLFSGLGIFLLDVLVSPKPVVHINGLYYILTGATYLLAEQVRKRRWLQILHTLLVILGIAFIILQDLNKLPFQTDLTEIALILYSTSLVIASETWKTTDENKKG